MLSATNEPLNRYISVNNCVIKGKGVNDGEKFVNGWKMVQNWNVGKKLKIELKTGQYKSIDSRISWSMQTASIDFNRNLQLKSFNNLNQQTAKNLNKTKVWLVWLISKYISPKTDGLYIYTYIS